MKKIFISQSNYIPWIGYFDSIALADEYVIYDDMQYTRRDWRNRNLIKTENGLKWLTIPVEVTGKYFQKINETRISDRNWTKSHFDTLKQNYKHARSYRDVIGWVQNLYSQCNYELLTDVNQYFLRNICDYLEIKTSHFKQSSSFVLHDEKTQRLVNICKELGGTDYYTGPAAKTYIDEALFEKERINVHYLDFGSYNEYEQIYPPFVAGVTILDLIFSEGVNAKRFLLNSKQEL